MTILVSTLGTSPGGVCEILRYLALKRGVKINEVILIRTSDPKVEFAFKLVKLMIKLCVGHDIKVSDCVFEKDDIESMEDLDRFRQMLTMLIEKHKNKEVHVDVTGGRKVMSIVTAIDCSKIAKGIYVAHISPEAYRYIGSKIEALKQRESVIDCLSKCVDKNLTVRDMAEQCGVIERVVREVKDILCKELIREKDVSIIPISI